MNRVERLMLAVVLGLTGLAAAGHYITGIPTIVAFILAALALAGQAWTVSFCDRADRDAVRPRCDGDPAIDRRQPPRVSLL